MIEFIFGILIAFTLFARDSMRELYGPSDRPGGESGTVGG